MSGFWGGAASASLPFQSLQQPPALKTTTPTEQQQRPTGPRQGRGTPGRQTYKSCDFCAKRKRKCDGKLPRCSLCVEKNQAYCHYQLKRPTKSRTGTGKPGTARPMPSTASSTSTSYATLLASSSSSSTSSGAVVNGVGCVGVGGTKRLAGQPPVSCGGNALAVPGARVFAMEQGLMSLKRCRLSASPATGMVGMQENAFLGDFFGCFGILPLATESIVRDAMVEVMTAALTPEHQQQQQLSLSGQGHAYGAVSGYVSLAREALANCFDGSTIENVRAYLMMSFLHGLMKDGEKTEKYLSFAMSIVSKLRPEDVPAELAAMILSTEKMRMFSNAEHTEGHQDTLTAYCQKLADLPPVGEVLHQKDLVKLFLVSDQRLTQAFITDMVSQGAIDLGGADVSNSADGKDGLAARKDRNIGEFLDQRVGNGLAGSRGQEQARTRVEEVEEVVEIRFPAWGCNAPELCCGDVDERDRQPCAGPAIRGFIEEVMPELSRLSKTLGRSDSTAGIGGVYYHGNLAYMQAVKGEMTNSFESLRACAEVVQRYPGIVRYRPHLLHCILAASHAWDRGMYDTIRRVYNSIGPVGCRPAPPFEEWGGMRQLCEHVFCRSVEREVQLIHNTKRHGEPATPASDPSFAPCDTSTDQEQEQVTASPSSSSSTSPSSPLDLDAAVASWTGVRPGSGLSGGGVHSDASGPVLAEAVRTGPMMAEADVVLKTEPPNTQHQDQEGAGQDLGATTVSGVGAAPDGHQPWHTHANTDPGGPSEQAPAPWYPTAATAAGVGWPGSAAVAEPEPTASGAEAAAGAVEPELVSASVGQGLGARKEEIGMGITDVDLLDISAVLMSEEGPLDDLP